jgi:hypothetical protein
MGTIKQLPNRRRRVHKVLGYLLLLVGVGVGLLQKYPEKASVGIFVLVLVGFLGVFLMAAVVGRPVRCPDCGKFLREETGHPRAAESYVYYCKRCDVIWDTLIAKSSD